MVGRLDRQIQETSRNQESLRRTELALIQAQVSPPLSLQHHGHHHLAH